MSIAEWGATLFSLIYLIYAIKNKPICFVYGIIASIIWAYVVFNAHLIFDTGLQVFYIIMSFIGLYRWKFGGSEKEEMPISVLKPSYHLFIILSSILISIGLYNASQYIEVINKPFLDALTTVLLVMGTILLVERKLYSWIYLVIADIGYLYIYGETQLWLLMGVMFVYIVFGMVGFFQWRALFRLNR